MIRKSHKRIVRSSLRSIGILNNKIRNNKSKQSLLQIDQPDKTNIFMSLYLWELLNKVNNFYLQIRDDIIDLLLRKF
jgi:hypothetical protein